MQFEKIKQQRGQGMVEYIVIVAALIAALYSNKSEINNLYEALKGSYEGYTYAISIAEMPDDEKAEH